MLCLLETKRRRDIHLTDTYMFGMYHAIILLYHPEVVKLIGTTGDSNAISYVNGQKENNLHRALQRCFFFPHKDSSDVPSLNLESMVVCYITRKAWSDTSYGSLVWIYIL